MDIKTLEYLEERAKKGRLIVNRIDYLGGKKEDINKSDMGYIEFSTSRNSFNLNVGTLSDEITQALTGVIEAEISRLKLVLDDL